jgi:hypothetical protein
MFKQLIFYPSSEQEIVLEGKDFLIFSPRLEGNWFLSPAFKITYLREVKYFSEPTGELSHEDCYWLIKGVYNWGVKDVNLAAYYVERRVRFRLKEMAENNFRAKSITAYLEMFF